MDQSLRELKTAHSIGWNGLYHKLDQHLFTGLRQEFFFPPLKLFPHTLLNVRKNLFFPSTHKGWKAQVFFKVSYGRHTKELLDTFLHLWGSIGAKE